MPSRPNLLGAGLLGLLLLMHMYLVQWDNGGTAFSSVPNISRVEKDVVVNPCGLFYDNDPDLFSCTLHVLVTFPSKDDGLPVAPVPIILILSGFQMPRSFYNSYAEQLASYGRYIVVQYDTSRSILKQFIPDQIEVQFIPQLLSFLAGEASDSTSPLYKRADVSRVGLMGHSRGAKLAALALASGVYLPNQIPLAARSQQRPASNHAGIGQDLGAEQKHQQQHQKLQQQQPQHDLHLEHLAELQQAEKDLQVLQERIGQLKRMTAGNGLSFKVPQLAAVLIDPVDSGSGSSPLDSQFPSAAEALTGQNQSAAIIGAGICGWCNPEDDGWRKFWPVLQSGWLQVVSDAGHLQFTDAKGATGWAWDKFCGSGALSHEEVQEFPVREALAWFGLAFEGKPPTGYIDWSLKQQERASFKVKDAETLHAE